MFPNRTTCSVNWQSVESVNRTVCPSDVYVQMPNGCLDIFNLDSFSILSL